ncbi:hypothetical protein APHAL10511_000811 [Amanita phalloides]|nr:hypothetical protein APHAL10511_000811 [Amanita phalloides]
MLRDDEYLRLLSQNETEWAAAQTQMQMQAQNIYSYPNPFYRNAFVYADENNFLATNHHTREQYSMPRDTISQLNDTSDMMIPEEVRSIDPRGGMCIPIGHFAASSVPLGHDPRMQSLERNVTVFRETVSHPMLSYVGSPATQISGNADNATVIPALTVARALEPEAPGTQSGPPYEAVEGGYRCISCDKVIKRQQDMHRHLTTTVRHGGKRLECPVCGEFYTRPTTLRDHVCVEL